MNTKKMVPCKSCGNTYNDTKQDTDRWRWYVKVIIKEYFYRIHNDILITE